MNKYAILQSHAPDICPLMNKKTKAFFVENAAKFPKLQKKLGVSVVTNVHLDPAHKVFTLFEAPSAEAVRDWIVQSGLMHIFQIEFYLVTPIDELMKHANDYPTIY